MLEALPAMSRLLNSTDPLVAAAAAAALGDIGGTEAVKVLEPREGIARRADQHQRSLARLCRPFPGRKREGRRPIHLRRIHCARPAADLRSAGLRGLVQTDPEKALPLLIAAIKGPNSKLGEAAIGLARSASGTETTGSLPGCCLPCRRKRRSCC